MINLQDVNHSIFAARGLIDSPDAFAGNVNLAALASALSRLGRSSVSIKWIRFSIILGWNSILRISEDFNGFLNFLSLEALHGDASVLLSPSLLGTRNN
jgi:hypothetical protein